MTHRTTTNGTHDATMLMDRIVQAYRIKAWYQAGFITLDQYAWLLCAMGRKKAR